MILKKEGMGLDTVSEETFETVENIIQVRQEGGEQNRIHELRGPEEAKLDASFVLRSGKYEGGKLLKS